jgi:hypothetical protein
MFESALAWLGYFPHHYWHRGEEPERVGMRHHYIVPYGPYMAADRVYVSLAVATPQDWEIFCRKVARRPDLLDDARFKTAPDRRKNRVVLEEIVEKMFLEQPHDEWMQRLRDAELPHGKLNGIGEVLAHPQTIARKMIREMESPVGPVPVIGSPLRLSDSPARFDPIPGTRHRADSARAWLHRRGDRHFPARSHHLNFASIGQPAPGERLHMTESPLGSPTPSARGNSEIDVTLNQPSRRCGTGPQSIREPPQIIQLIDIEFQTRVSKNSYTCATRFCFGQVTRETVRAEVRREENGG